MNKKTYKKLAIALLASVAVADTASAQVVYQDSFNRTGYLALSPPDVTDTNGNVYTVVGGFVSPSQVWTANTGTASSGGNYGAAFLPVNGGSGVTLDGSTSFTLSVNVATNSTGNGNGPIGIVLADSKDATGNAFAYGSGDSGFLAAEGLSNNTILHANNFTTGEVYTSVGTTLGTLDLSYAAGVGGGTLSYVFDGTTYGTISVTDAQIQALNYVGIQSDFNYGTVSNFELDIAQSSPVPEPSTYALMLAGLGFLVFVARRRLMV